MRNLKQYIKEVLEELEELEEASVSGGIGGFATPLGTGPNGKIRYKSSSATDKEHRSNKKSSKNREGSVQHTLNKKNKH